MPIQNIVFSTNASKCDLTQQSNTKEIIAKCDACKVSRRQRIKSVIATLSVVLQILTLKLQGNLTGIIAAYNIIRFASDFMSSLGKFIAYLVNTIKVTITILFVLLVEMAILMVHTMSVIYQILEVVLQDTFNTMDEFYGIILTTAKKDVPRNRAVDRHRVARGAMGRIVVKNEISKGKNVTSGDRHSESLEKEKHMEQLQFNINPDQQQSAAKSNMLDVVQIKYINKSTIQLETVPKSVMLDDVQKAFISNFIMKSTIIESKDNAESSVNKPHSNAQTIGEQKKSDSNTQNDDSGFPIYSPSAVATVQRPVDKLAKWRRNKFLADETHTEPRETVERQDSMTEGGNMAEISDVQSSGRDKPSMDQNGQTLRHTRRRGPTTRPRVLNPTWPRPWNHPLYTYAPTTMIPPRPYGGQFMYGNLQSYRTYGPPMLHRWHQANTGPRSPIQYNGFRPEHQNPSYIYPAYSFPHNV